MGLYQWMIDFASREAEGPLSGLDLDPKELAKEGIESMARSGAKLLLQVALLMEVQEFLGRQPYERSEGFQAGYRNGYRDRTLTCGSGSIEVKIPKVKGADEPFHIQSIPAYKRTSEEILDLIPALYAEGVSTRDFKRAFGSFWEKAGLSRSSISRANKKLQEEFRAWSKRDLSQYRVLYLFLDGVNERVRLKSKEKEGVLVAHAILEDGSRVVLALQLGPKESAATWGALIESMTRRGLQPPKLVITDGNPGVIKAVKDWWPQVPRQRCVVHKTRNVLDRVPRKSRGKVKQALHKIFYATDLKAAERATEKFLERFGREFPAACETLARDLGDCLVYFKFPRLHWKRIRSTNVIERTFKEVRRRTKVVGRFPNERAALTLIWASLVQEQIKWRGIKVDDELLREASEAAQKTAKSPLRIKCAKKYLEAA